MKIDLPLEVWVDSFKSLSRKQLAALLPHIGDEQEETKNRPIADRQFVKNVQFYLHEWGNVTLGYIYIQSSSKGPIFMNDAGHKLPLAEVPPMPANIKSFMCININYYDESVLVFLQEFRSMLTNVHLFLSGENRRQLNAMLKMMPHLLPSITSIESLNSYHCYDHNAALFQAGFFKEELSDMLTSARILYECHFGFGYDDWYRHWLHIPREDGKPRVLVATYVKSSVNRVRVSPILPFIENIKEDFLDANQAVSFFACIRGKLDANVQSISLTHDKTQEQLVIKANVFPPVGCFVTISRYPMGMEAKAEEWTKENAQIIRGIIHCQERKIGVYLNI